MTRGAMNSKQFQKYVDRDGSCPHCGSTELIPQHRQNRGMGGSKERNRPSNIIAFCSLGNGLMESNATFAQLARDYGWKLTAGQDPSNTPVLLAEGWVLLDDNFAKVKANPPEQD